MSNRPRARDLLWLAFTSVLAILLHGYHPAVEDAEIYLPGIKKALNPSLYPYNDVFFMSHARMTFFPKFIASIVHILHLPLYWVLLLLQAASVFLLLLGCWHLGRLAFRNSLATWGGVALVASLLTMPVAGTALVIMDEYVNPRSLSTPAVLFVIGNVVERRFTRAIVWALFTAAIHPLMVVFGTVYAVIYLGVSILPKSGTRLQRQEAVIASWIPFGLFPPATEAYRQALNSRHHFFLLRWQWYEWLGAIGPLLLFGWWRCIAHRSKKEILERFCDSSVVFGCAFLVMGLIITIPPGLVNFVELQPMRSLQLLYIFMLLFGGGLLAQHVLRKKIWRWALLFVPLCAGMGFAEYQTFPNTPHLELPWTHTKNDWVMAFDWIRQNTPVDAYFALDPETMSLPGEDQHGFRAVADRSQLADNVKDTGAVTMFPAMANQWQQQVQALSGWNSFREADFLALKKKFGIDWIVVRKGQLSRFNCPYSNNTLAVCEVN